jgi:hypothetical protein
MRLKLMPTDSECSEYQTKSKSSRKIEPTTKK